jgi:hypothetical protein
MFLTMLRGFSRVHEDDLFVLGDALQHILLADHRDEHIPVFKPDYRG